MQETGQAATFWLARIALALYAWAFVLQLRRSWRLERRVHTLALASYLLHVVCAFQFFYHWSHSFALQETARQTGRLFGVHWDGGLYLNYLLTAVWLADCALSWSRPGGRAARPRWAGWAVNGFLMFMFFNGSAVVWVMKAWRAE